MIHIENVTINIHPMSEVLFSEQKQEGLNEAEAHATGSMERTLSVQWQAQAWQAVCELLYEVSPYWNSGGPGCAKENAIAAIRAMAKAR